MASPEPAPLHDRPAVTDASLPAAVPRALPGRINWTLLLAAIGLPLPLVLLLALLYSCT